MPGSEVLAQDCGRRVNRFPEHLLPDTGILQNLYGLALPAVCAEWETAIRFTRYR
jgi:hypothetical protein